MLANLFRLVAVSQLLKSRLGILKHSSWQSVELTQVDIAAENLQHEQSFSC